jgi:cytochrome P450
MNDIEKATDEILTIFFAGSQTSSNVSQNLILHLCKNPHYKAKIQAEINEKDSEFNFYTQCFNEAMRI